MFYCRIHVAYIGNYETKTLFIYKSLAEEFDVSSTRPPMPDVVRRFRGLLWPETGPGPLSGFGWGVFEKPWPIAEGDSTSFHNDLAEPCMIKQLPS